MMNGRYILIDREPIQCADLLEWARWCEHVENHRVRLTRVGPVEVSTVFLGLDHAFGGGPPLLFETMVGWGERDKDVRELFDGTGANGFLDIQERCSTWAEAEALFISMWNARSKWMFALQSIGVAVNLMQAGAGIQRLLFPNYFKWRYIARHMAKYGVPDIELVSAVRRAEAEEAPKQVVY